jgi:nitrite reductase (NADH) small subunit
MSKHQIGTVEDFPEGTGTRAEVDGIEVAVFNLDGDLHAVQNTCPHKRLPLHVAGSARVDSEELKNDRIQELENSGCSPEEIEEQMTERTRGKLNSEEGTIHCPWHYLEWDVDDGSNPVRDQQIATFDVEVEDEEVHLIV